MGDAFLHIHYYQALHINCIQMMFLNTPVQLLDGIELGSYDEAGMFTSTCIISKTGNGYIHGRFRCGGLVTAPTIYSKAQVETLLNGKQNTLM